MKQKLYLSTISEDAPELACRNGLGLELAEFCYAGNLDFDYETCLGKTREKMAGADRFWFHGPFAELCPAAIDPLVRQVTAKRYAQAWETAQRLGIRRMVLHGGFVPQVYFPEWYIAEAVKFWKAELAAYPQDMTIALENVMEPHPEILSEVVRQVDDPRLGLCLDVGHANLTETPLEEWISTMTPWLRHVHLHNNDGRTDQHEELDRGVIPVVKILEQLEKCCPEATVTLEVRGGEASLNFLRKENYL